jgi:CBS domain-containing protein
MRVGDVMTTTPVTIGPDAHVVDAIRQMLERRISGMPVVDRGSLVGILTEGDLLRRAELGTERKRPRWLAFLLGAGRQADDYTRTHARRVAEVMTSDVVTATEDTTLEELVGIMTARDIKRVPVMRAGAVVGIISRSDLLRALRRVITSQPTTPERDAAIRSRILADMAAQSWAPTALVNVQVSNSTVELSGSLVDERQRTALRVLAENVPGVVGVVDRLVYVEPNSGWVIGPDQTPPASGAAAA